MFRGLFVFPRLGREGYDDVNEDDEDTHPPQSSSPPPPPPPSMVPLTADDVEDAFRVAEHNESLFPQLEDEKDNNNNDDDQYRNIMVFKVCAIGT